MKLYPSLTIAIALISGLVVSFLDMILGYSPLPHIIVLVGAIILSMFNTKQSWVIALILGGSIPMAHGVLKVFGVMPPYEFHNIGELIMPIVLAFGGSMIGVRTSVGWMKTSNSTVSNEEQE